MMMNPVTVPLQLHVDARLMTDKDRTYNDNSVSWCERSGHVNGVTDG